MIVKKINVIPLDRQLQHWLNATSRLGILENLASSHAWDGIDTNIRQTILESMHRSVDRLRADGQKVKNLLAKGNDYDAMQRSVLAFRQRYLDTESTIHFFSDALNSRTNSSTSSLLRACDIMCRRSMEHILKSLGKEVPYCFTYLDKGLGASILKSGMRLWDGSVSTVAAIKITFHNLLRPTAAIHETGHQVAHILNWNDELASQLRKQLQGFGAVVANAFSSWSSEIAADIFAFVHTGYAAVASLHNVVVGGPRSVFLFHEGDPHPISFLRILFNIECCKFFYGNGPWTELEENFKEDYSLDRYNPRTAPLIRNCEKALRVAVETCLTMRFKAFGGKCLCDIIDPGNVSPEALHNFERTIGVLEHSNAWINNECLRMLALSGLRIATAEREIETEFNKQRDWALRLGNSSTLN